MTRTSSNPSVGQRVSAALHRAADWIAPNSAQNSGISSSLQQATALRSLSPVFDEAEHGGYVEILTAELRKFDEDAPRNVALTGHYGSGKSSVLLETEKRLAERGIAVINLSLPSLGVGDGRLPEKGDHTIDRTNLIQKEIVKQLLYRRRPGDTPASRYNRLDTFDEPSAKRRAAIVGGVAIFVGFLIGLPKKIEHAVPNVAWDWIDKRTFDHFSSTIQWLSLLFVFGFTLMFSVWLQRLLQQRLRITELGAGAGPATVKLSEPTASYFDEYLDEIVYYFQTSGTTVVVFEDLDRFKDPHIFEALRELNLLLNNAEQTGITPIKFVYAIRDSIFEQLDTKSENRERGGEGSEDPEPPTVASAGGNFADKIENRRLVTTNRTKFFDLVVPMVPFISHRTSRDLMLGELKSIPVEDQPGREVVDLVSAYITDMRLIKNVCNEYDIFRTRILRDGGLKQLTSDKLFASIVYKNLFLLDYEKVRNGTSLLDDLYAAYRDWVAQSTALSRKREREARMALRRKDGMIQRSKQLGRRLRQVLDARIDPSFTLTEIALEGLVYPLEKLESVEFWSTYSSNQSDLRVTYQGNPYYNQSVIALSFNKVQTLMGKPIDPSVWKQDDRDVYSAEIAQAASDQLRFAHGSLSDAITSTEDTFEHDGEVTSMEAVAESMFAGAPIVVDLIRSSYIDENFTLYVTQFPGESSASAMNFIIKSVQPNLMDIDYHFGLGAESSESDIQSAIDAEGHRIMNGKSVYNREIFDYLLRVDPSKLDDPIRRLAANAGEDTTFIDAYVASGKQVATFIRSLSGVWSQILDYVLGQEAGEPDLNLIDAAISGVVSTITYSVSDAQRDVLAGSLEQLPVVLTPQSRERASHIGNTLTRIGVAAPSLKKVAAPLFGELVAHSAYAITLENLETIMADREISLDEIRADGPDSVYENLLNHLSEYLSIIEENPSVLSIRQSDQFVAVISEIAERIPTLVEPASAAAHQDCIVEDHSDIDSTIWPALVRATRFRLTAKNVIAYVEEFSFDAPLSNALESADGIKDNVNEGERLKLALLLSNTGEISAEARLRLIASLKLNREGIDPSELNEEGEVLIPDFVRAGMVADNAGAFNAIGAANWTVKSRLMIASRAFPAYVTSLNLSTNDLHVISWSTTPDAIKTVVLDNISLFGPTLGDKGAAALLHWAVASNYAASPEAINLLALKGRDAGAQAAIKLVGPHASSMDIDLLIDILSRLGGVYPQLSTRGRDRPKVPAVEGIQLVLARLRDACIVSKFEYDSGKDLYKVSKHH